MSIAPYRSGSQREKKLILLVNPSPWEMTIDIIPKPLPLALLSVASTVIDEYEVVVLDRAVKKNDAELKRHLIDPSLFCVGLSVLTGPCIVDAVYCSKLVRKLSPETPIVWGGWHATQVPQSILSEPYVDYIVQGEGEIAFPELLKALEDPDRSKTIPGVGYRSDEGIQICPPGPFLDMEDFPLLPFELIKNIEPYVFENLVPEGGPCLHLEAGRGCPYSCTFCEVTNYFGKHNATFSAERILQQLRVMKERYNVGGIRFQDPNFFLRIKRARDFANLLIEESFDLKWGGEGTIMQFRKVPIDELRHFHRAGLRFVSFGIESGSERLRKTLNKKLTDADIEQVMRKFEEVGIEFRFNVILGLPGESVEESLETIDFAIGMISDHPRSRVGLNMCVYMPFPKTPLSEVAVEHGYEPPKTLEGFAQISYSAAGELLPWLSKKHSRLLSTASHMSRFLAVPGQDIPFRGVRKLVFAAIRKYFLFRFRRGWLMETPEIALLKKVVP